VLALREKKKGLIYVQRGEFFVKLFLIPFFFVFL